MNAFESIKQGLEDAKAFSKGRGPNAIVHELAVPDIDVSEIRARTGLSQAEFARSIGVAKKNAAQLGIWTAHSQRASLGVVGFDCSEAFGRSRFARQLTTNTFC
jgi:predicted ABC-class ATPase